MRSTFASLSFLALILAFSCSLACTQPASEDASKDAATATSPTDEEPKEPAQFRDGFETGDTSAWNDDANEAEGETEEAPKDGDKADGKDSDG